MDAKTTVDTKIIRTEQQYRAYLDEVQALIAAAPQPASPEAERLEVLSVLIESYESQKFPVEPPDPIDAILFRMKEKGLKQADLVPYFGTRSRVSEILGRKRPLTVPMVRALSAGLSISADTLIGQPKDRETSAAPDWSQFPIKELVARGWIRSLSKKGPTPVSDAVRDFIRETLPQFGTATFKRSLNGEAYSPSTKFALFAWLSGVIHKARKKKLPNAFDPTLLNTSFLKELAQLSWFDEGPLLAVEFLEKHGIAVVIEPALKGTMIDGGALKDNHGAPIIGLTLRHDRLDNFWFTLMHEVAHIWKHVDNEQTFLDDLDATSEDRREAEANRISREAFIPRLLWKRSNAYLNPSYASIDELSRQLKIHPSIVAGRIRRESGNFQVFSDIIGYGAIRKLFPTN